MKTINLRNYRLSSHAPAVVFAGVLLVLILLNGVAEWQRPTPTVATPTPALIYVLSTREPPKQPTADPRVEQEIASLKARLAELEAKQQAPETIYREMTIEQQAPTATPWHADPPITYSAAGSTAAISVPTDAPRLCTGFDDWRDYDAMYQASPACHKATP
jgi:hypothetical protein